MQRERRDEVSKFPIEKYFTEEFQMLVTGTMEAVSRHDLDKHLEGEIKSLYSHFKARDIKSGIVFLACLDLVMNAIRDYEEIPEGGPTIN